MHIGLKDILYCTLIWLVGALYTLTSYWVDGAGMHFDGILFHIKYVNTFSIGHMLTDNLRFLALIVFLLVFILYCLIFIFMPNHKGKITAIISLIFISFVCNKLDIINYIKLRYSKDDFYLYNWVKPEASFENKEQPNLILLTVESLENTFADKKLWDESLIKNLSHISKKGYSFNGFTSISGTWWTMGSIVGAWCGIPLTLPTGVNIIYNNKNFLSGAYCLPDILKDNNYKLFYIKGSKTEFAGMNVFLKSHGYEDENIEDYYTLIKKDKNLPTGGKWGVRDVDVYKYFKKKILELSQENKPFFAAMQTIDTHTPFYELPDICSGNNGIFEDVIRCADKQAAEFVDWFHQQSFANDTVLAIIGDHLFMNAQLEAIKIKLPQNNRSIFNLFINTRLTKQVDTNRRFTAMDVFPTILEALGMSVKNNRAALGVSLFSPTRSQTLLERYGQERLEQELLKNSKIYNSFLSPKQGSK